MKNSKTPVKTQPKTPIKKLLNNASPITSQNNSKMSIKKIDMKAVDPKNSSQIKSKPQIKNINISRSTTNIKPTTIYRAASPTSVNKKLMNCFSNTNINTDFSLKEAGALTRINSLKPFPNIDHEFYSDKKDLLWDTEKLKAESKILSRQNSAGKFSQSQMLIFNKSDVFSNRSKYVETTVNKVSNPSRARDYHSQNKLLSDSELTADTTMGSRQGKPCVVNGKKGQIKTIQIDLKPAKVKITPMHLKLYESTLQNSLHVPKNQLPTTHPSLQKDDDTYKPLKAASSQKRVQFMKTTYNFLKNYY